MVDAGGKLISSYGDLQTVAFLRSSAKPFQALPFVERGGVEYFGLTPRELSETRGSACRKIISAMTTHPEMVSAYGEFDEQLMRAGAGKIVCKRGAEGYQLIGLLPGVLRPDALGIGIALKVSDGDPTRTALELTHSTRVRPAVTLEILRQLGTLSSEQEQALAVFGPVQNHRGLVTGQSRPVFELQLPA